MQKIHMFGGGTADGTGQMKAILGGKGAGLAEMARLGLPVPPGFTIPISHCQGFYAQGQTLSESLLANVSKGIARIESLMKRQLGDSAAPLLVSVRSGAASSMPGMMDTILNLGLNDVTVEGLAQQNPRFAWDSYRRFIQMYGDVVMGIPQFEEVLEAKKREKGVESDLGLSAEDLCALTRNYLQLVKDSGKIFPQDPRIQLKEAIAAVFLSWNSKRAQEYRRIHQISDDGGTAVTVQAMVFGNRGEDCATGVAFTRNPSTGEKVFFGEFLQNAQGEDVVAGTRTPLPIAEMAQRMPKAYQELRAITTRLEQHFHDMQDIEFTVERNVVWMLQARSGKRSSRAAVKIAVDMTNEGLITQTDAILRVQPKQIDQLLHPMVDPQAQKTILAKGLAASPGAAVGQVVFDADEAVQWAHGGKKVILVRTETSPEDIQGMHVATGFLTARGGMTSHAAVVARGMGKPCVVGCHALRVNGKSATFANGEILNEGDWLSIDGASGEIMLGQVALITPTPDAEFETLMTWADQHRHLRVRANADTPEDAALARQMGAEGIGLCRTEHMFFAEGRLQLMRQMIVARTPEARKVALDALLPIQTADFRGIFQAMVGLPVTIRLLDPPLHEFLPQESDQQKALALRLGVPTHELQHAVAELYEMNPMLGHRGCRLAITYPEIYEMQVRAIMTAATELAQEGVQCHPEIEIPLVAHVNEFVLLRKRVDAVCQAVMKSAGVAIPYKMGTMIELPRAALTADQIAAHADFFSFGTNDLTQTTFGLSRDDAGKFLPQYLEQGLLTDDPFVTIDPEGVGALMQLAIEKGRRCKPQLEIGICGEHGGDPKSILFCHQLGLDYVSCSPYRVPVARLAAAHAALQNRGQGRVRTA